MSSNTQDLAIRANPLHAAGVMAWREVIRFFRQRNRVVGAIGQPVLFWLLFSVGMNRSFQVSGRSFREYYIPGTVMLIVLFTAIFATISIIEDRKEGFLQSVLVAPVPRWSMVLGKVLGGALIGFFQGLIFLCLLPLAGVRFGTDSLLGILGLLSVCALALTSLGFVIAWRLDSTQGFHAVMSLLLMPMWLLSGAFFPVPAVDSNAATSEIAMHWLMRLNPVTYGIAGLRQFMFATSADDSLFWLPHVSTCWLVSILFAVLMFAMAWRIAGRSTLGDLL